MIVAALLAIALVTGRAAAQQDTTRAGLETRLAQGDMAWDREDHPAARAAYELVVRADSTFSTRALYRLGLLHAWDSKFDDALSALRRYVRAEPADLAGRVALARTYAWASRFPASLAQYDTVLARDAGYRDAVIGKGQALAWDNQLPQAEAHLERWLAAHADDVEAWSLRIVVESSMPRWMRRLPTLPGWNALQPPVRRRAKFGLATSSS